MDFSSLSYPAVGTICAALIAGLISFVVTVLAKDQKISEFRQAWIDALRSDAAELARCLENLGRFMDEATAAMLTSQDWSEKQFSNEKSTSRKQRSSAVLIYHKCEKVIYLTN